MRADFTGAQLVPVEPGLAYSFAPLHTTTNNVGIFAPPDPEFRFRPLSGIAVPGMANTIGVARQFGGVDFLNVINGDVTPLLQIPVAPYPWFAPSFNMDDPMTPEAEPAGELYTVGESGLLGVAFHPDFATNRKFYVSVTVQNPDAPLIPDGVGINPRDGIQPDELAKMNDPNDPAGIAFRACFVCDHPGQDFPVAVGSDINGDTVPDGNWGPECQNDWQKVHARFPTLMQIREYTAPNDGTEADPSDYRTVLSFPRRFDFHNSGAIRFGTDGMLYLSSGDSQGTPQETDFDTLGDSEPQTPAHDFYGKILRLDIDGNDNIPGNEDDDGFAGNDDKNYQIPANNPFAGGIAADDEVYAYGLRNPWSMTVDAVTGDLWIGDVGYNSAEEINVVPASSGGGQNFGWPHFEGSNPTPGVTVTAANPAGPTPPVSPIHDYPTIVGGARGFVIGGFVYRGPDPELQGKFIFYEAGRREVYSFDPNNPAEAPENITSTILGGGADPGGLFAAFGQDAEGNLFLISHSEGKILRILTSNPNPNTLDAANIGTTEPGEPGTRGDFNSDGFVNAKDIDLLALAAKNFPNHPLYDLEGSDGVTFQSSTSGIISDSDELIRSLVEIRDVDGIKQATGTEYGDANLNGEVFLSDLIELATNYRQSGQFGWADANFNGSLEAGTATAPRVSLIDLIALASHWRFGIGTGSGSSIEVVPEPGTWFMSVAWLLVAFRRNPRQR